MQWITLLPHSEKVLGLIPWLFWVEVVLYICVDSPHCPETSTLWRLYCRLCICVNISCLTLYIGPVACTLSWVWPWLSAQISSINNEWMTTNVFQPLSFHKPNQLLIDPNL